jgi:hypothetical protein
LFGAPHLFETGQQIIWTQPGGLDSGGGRGSVLDVRSHCIIARAALLSGAFVAMKSIQVNHDLIESGRIVAPGS